MTQIFRSLCENNAYSRPWQQPDFLLHWKRHSLSNLEWHFEVVPFSQSQPIVRWRGSPPRRPLGPPPANQSGRRFLIGCDNRTAGCDNRSGPAALARYRQSCQGFQALPSRFEDLLQANWQLSPHNSSGCSIIRNFNLDIKVKLVCNWSL